MVGVQLASERDLIMKDKGRLALLSAAVGSLVLFAASCGLVGSPESSTSQGSGSALNGPAPVQIVPGIKSDRGGAECILTSELGYSVAKGCRVKSTDEEGAFYWITQNWDVLPDRPAGNESDGYWYWVMPDGVVIPRSASTPGAWYWVTATGEVSRLPTSNDASGGWLKLASPDQVASSSTTGGFWTPSSETRWYFTPKHGSSEGPIWGGSDSAPVAPPSLEAPPPASDPWPYGTSGCEGPSLIEDRGGGTLITLPGSDIGTDVGCATEFRWVSGGHVREDPGVGFTIGGTLNLVTDPPNRISIEADVASGGARGPVVTAIRGTFYGVPITGTATASAAPQSLCRFPGVALDAVLTWGTSLRHLTIAICDDELATDLLG